MKRVFWIVLDSFGIGDCPDADRYNDRGSNTLGAIRFHPAFHADTMERLGLFRIDGVGKGGKAEGAYARLFEQSAGKDTTTGHWELAGSVLEKPFPTYPNGFPAELLEQFSRLTGRGVLCNRPYSGTKVIQDYGEEHLKTGKWIVYTSADSVFQVAAHEDVVSVEELYAACKTARALLQGEHAVGRVIARPFTGKVGAFVRTSRRHDFSLLPPETVLDRLKGAGFDVIGVGKIADIFAGKGLTRDLGVNRNNEDGMAKTARLAEVDFRGLCFVNLVDFDMLYGHRNDIAGYAKAIGVFDDWLKGFLPKLGVDDLLLITADHGCDPSTPSTDHSREAVPLLIYGKRIKPINLGTRYFSDVAATIAECFGVSPLAGTSFYKEIV